MPSKPQDTRLTPDIHAQPKKRVTPEAIKEFNAKPRGASRLQPHPNNAPKPRDTQSDMMHPLTAFYIFLLTNVLAAFFVPIQDCDETYNYWEPTHYLNHGFGLQTWEYSPEYAIRSWFYIVIHAIPGKLGYLLSSSRTFEFYFTRVVLAFICAGTESRLFQTISRTLNPRIGIMWMMAMVFSPGMFYASVAFLPSSFSMYTTMMGTAAFMDWQGGLKTAPGIMWFGIGSIIGWPFSAALILPLLLEDFFLAMLTGDISEEMRNIVDGLVRSILVLVSVFPPLLAFRPC